MKAQGRERGMLLGSKAWGGGQWRSSFALSIPEPVLLVLEAVPSWPEEAEHTLSSLICCLSASPGASSRSNRRKPKIQASTTPLGGR